MSKTKQPETRELTEAQKVSSAMIKEMLLAKAQNLYSSDSHSSYYEPSSIPDNHTVIGACSLCGGAVVMPTAWLSVVPPTPTCSSCHAVRSSHGPVIDMTPSPSRQMNSSNSGTTVFPLTSGSVVDTITLPFNWRASSDELL